MPTSLSRLPAAGAASQGVGVATGIQEKFNWKSVALAAIGGAVGGRTPPAQRAGQTVNVNVVAIYRRTWTRPTSFSVSWTAGGQRYDASYKTGGSVEVEADVQGILTAEGKFKFDVAY